MLQAMFYSKCTEIAHKDQGKGHQNLTTASGTVSHISTKFVTYYMDTDTYTQQDQKQYSALLHTWDARK